MDKTFTAVMFFTFFKLLGWVAVVVFATAIGRRIYRVYLEQDTFLDALWLNKWLAGSWIILLFISIMLTSMETVYRPKSEINITNPKLSEEVKTIDNSLSVVIPTPTVSFKKLQEESRFRFLLEVLGTNQKTVYDKGARRPDNLLPG